MRPTLLLGLLLVAAAVVRLWIASGDLWFDEIWSLSFAREMTVPWQVLTGIHHDNNHPLNTLSLFLTVKIAGPFAAPLVFRLVPLAAGIATIALIFRTESRSGDREAARASWIATILAAVSVLGIAYSSEARGYALVALFALAAFACVRYRALDQPRDRLVFAALCVLGLLSHLTFLFVYAGLAAWTFVRCREGGSPWRRWIALHQLPAGAMAGVYLIDVRYLVYGGGPAFRISEVVGRALSLLGGGPPSGRWLIVVAAFVVMTLAYGFVVVARTRRDEAVFFATALVLAPAGVLLVYQARYLDVRYFYVLFPFVWMLAARALAQLWATGRPGRIATAAAIALTIAGNIRNTAPLAREGRGHYQEIVDTIARLTPGDRLTIGSDFDFPSRMVLEYYTEMLAAREPQRARAGGFEYVDANAWTPTTPEWVLTHDFKGPRSAAASTPPVHASPERYVPVRCFSYGGISGWNWCLHRLSGSRSSLQP